VQIGKSRARKRALLSKNRNKQGKSGAYASGGTAAVVSAVVCVSGAYASGGTVAAVGAVIT